MVEQRRCCWTALTLLAVCYFSNGFSSADHHPFCQTSCAGLKMRSSRFNCLLNCGQDLGGMFFRAGRTSPYLGLLSPSYAEEEPPEDLERIIPETIELPIDEIVAREPRDRSAFVRIGKRDVSEAAKRRDEFVRIGKSWSKGGNRSPFLLGRSFTGRVRPGFDDLVVPNRNTRTISDDPAASSALLIPVSGAAVKRPSAFVRIGKRNQNKKEADEETAASSSKTPASVDSSNMEDMSHAAADELIPVVDGHEELEKKASAFVRIGRKGAAFVRIGKSDQN